MDRYCPDTIAKAGFKIDDQEVEGFSQLTGVNRHTVIGTNRHLVHDYIFTSRDVDRKSPVNSQAANSLVQLVGLVMQNQTVASAVGKEKLYQIFNEIFRLSGAGIDLNLAVQPGEDNTLGGDQIKQFQQVVEQMQQAMQQLATAVQSDTSDIQKQKQLNQTYQQHFEVLAKIAKEVETLVGKGAAKVPDIKYDTAPSSIQSQIEQRHGFNPAPAAGEGSGNKWSGDIKQKRNKVHYKKWQRSKKLETKLSFRNGNYTFVGIVVQSVPGATSCNLYVTPLQGTQLTSAGECLHLDDVMAADIPAPISPGSIDASAT